MLFEAEAVTLTGIPHRIPDSTSPITAPPSLKTSRTVQ